jgi:serine/threonine-protein kinase
VSVDEENEASPDTAPPDGERGSPESAPTYAIGTKLGRYRIDALVGEVGGGGAYEASDDDGRRFILEVLPAGAFADAAVRARFVDEGRKVSAVIDPNLAAFDVGEVDDGSVFLATELVSGRTLRERIAASPDGMPKGEAIGIAIQIARGVGKAHAAGIVHRDLVPDNVTVADDGTVKVAGFDLARLLVSDEGEAAALGSPGYMSPEQARGADVTKSADVFSIGVLLYEMATGERPFAGETRAEILDAIAKEAPAAPSVAAVGVPRALDPIVLKCLASDPAARYPDGAALAAALEAVPLPRARRSFPAWIIPVVATIAAVGAVVSGIGAPKPVSRLATRREISSIYRALARAAAAPAPPGSSGP